MEQVREVLHPPIYRSEGHPKGWGAPAHGGCPHLSLFDVGGLSTHTPLTLHFLVEAPLKKSKSFLLF